MKSFNQYLEEAVKTSEERFDFVQAPEESDSEYKDQMKKMYSIAKEFNLQLNFDSKDFAYTVGELKGSSDNIKKFLKKTNFVGHNS